MSGADKLFCVADARARARRRLPRMMFDYIDGAAGAEQGARRNYERLDQVLLQPRVLVNVEERQLGRDFLGRAWGLPFGIAPMGMCDLTWPGADRALAAAAVRHAMPHCLSTAASTSLEDGRRMAGENAWFQLYVRGPQEAAFELVRRAENAGYQYLILTVDVPVVAPRRRELRHGFKMPFKLGYSQVLDFALHPHWSIETLRQGIPEFGNYPRRGNRLRKGGANAMRQQPSFARESSGGATDWAILDKLRERWPHKLIVKGVLSPEDAVKIKDRGADAIYVSNHGGRQLDSAPAAICALPAIRRAVGNEFPLVFDSGIRSGECVVKALALGADFVMLGRPFLYALGAAGEQGLARVIQLLTDELSHTLAQIGRPNALDLDSSVIADTMTTPCPMPVCPVQGRAASPGASFEPSQS